MVTQIRAALVFIVAVVVGLIACGGSRDAQPRIINGEFLTETDRAKISADIAELNTIAAANALEPLPADRFTIEIVERSPNCDKISFELRYSCRYDPNTNPDCYDGSIHDRDPAEGEVSMCVAGRYIPETSRIQVTVNGIRLSPIVRYEGEHHLLRLRNPTLYQQTLAHREGGHPILTIPPCECVRYPCNCWPVATPSPSGN